MNIKVWTPRYIANRIKLAIRQQLYKDEPWLTSDAVKFLDKYLLFSDVGLEFGSGKSTVWFAKRIRKLTSIETDYSWYLRVDAALTNNNFKNVNLKIVPQEPYTKYINVSSIPEESLDFVLVDGHHRHTATEISIPLLKKGGLLIIDNINWYIPSPFSIAPGSVRETKHEWIPIIEKLYAWRCYWTTDGITDTAIWFKNLTC
ncbi:class I SAM-dependent methyltransferase [Nitrospira defluvii]|nr:class I SAM-dependent methyltransferase [Nitrospira defluvii]